jgi:hypothetical protein
VTTDYRVAIFTIIFMIAILLPFFISPGVEPRAAPLTLRDRDVIAHPPMHFRRPVEPGL